MIFSARQLQEKCIEQQKPLFMTFFDLSKALDSIDRGCLWEILYRYGCPPKFINIIRLFHDNMTATVRANGLRSDAFLVETGVKQGCLCIGSNPVCTFPLCNARGGPVKTQAERGHTISQRRRHF